MTESKIQIRVSAQEKALWQGRSAQMGLTLTEMIKEAVGEFVMTDKGSVMTDIGTMVGPKKEEIKTSTEVEKLVKRGLVKKGVKELPSQDEGGFKTYFK